MAKRTVTPAQNKAYKKYIEGTDEIRVRAPKGTKELISDHLGKTGETMQEFILRAALEAMDRDKLERFQRLFAYKEKLDQLIRQKKEEEGGGTS